MKKRMCCLCALLLALCLLTGCLSRSRPASDPSSGEDRSAGRTETAAPAADSAESEAQTTEAPTTESATGTPATESATEDPATEPATEAPATESATETPATEPAAAQGFFVQEADKSFTNDWVRIRNEDGRILRQELVSGTETELFRLEQNDKININLVGVTENRLYFGWNEVEDWWGWNIYSVDYAGGNRTEYGEAWDPDFEGGWLILYGFRSDVSATELRVIDRDDMLAVDLENVWDGTVGEDGAFYFVYGGELPSEISEWFEHHAERDVEYRVLKLTPEGDFSILGSLFFDTYYMPCFIGQGTIGCPDVGEYYDLYTLEPTDEPSYG